MIYFVCDSELDTLIDIIDMTDSEKLEYEAKHKNHILVPENKKDIIFTSPFDDFDD